MDSVTQFVLGAAVGEAVIGRRIGRKAILWGGFAGTLPDLDVYIHMGDAVRDFTYHRSFSHSLFVLAVVTPLMVWLARRLHPKEPLSTGRWALMFYLVFTTHVLLDSFTAYGTQIFWPLITTPMTWSTIFIIDPAYTLPLIVGVLSALVFGRRTTIGFRVNQLGLMISSLYLAWTLAAKVYVDHRIEQSLDQQQVEYRTFFTGPTPFNSLLWRAVIMDDNGYYEAFYSLFDGQRPLHLEHYKDQKNLLDSLHDHFPVQRLQWFSKGFYSVKLENEDILINDLRMGVEPNYVFSFKVAELANPHVNPVSPVRVPTQQDYSKLEDIWQRIWNESTKVGYNNRPQI